MAKTTKNTQPKTTKVAASKKAKEGTVIQIEPKKTAKKAKKATAEALELPTLGADGAEPAFGGDQGQGVAGVLQDERHQAPADH